MCWLCWLCWLLTFSLGLCCGTVGSDMGIVSSVAWCDCTQGAAGNLAAAVNAVQIQLLNLVYGHVARYLNDLENHATQTQFEDNLIAKTFCFQFINSYFSLFYVAFIKNYLELFGEKQECTLNLQGEPDCLSELSAQLSIIFLTRLVVGNATEALVPWFKFWMLQRKEARLAKKEHREAVKKSPAEIENDMQE